MTGRNVRNTAVAAMAIFSMPVADAEAFWNKCCGRPAPVVATYAPAPVPVVAAYAPAAPCCTPAPQVVNYMPQVAYRTVYVNTPVVSYSPMPACDACGRSTTVMRPVTTFVTQARMVPYTTYRPVMAAMPCCGAAAPVATPAYYAPSVPVAPAMPVAPVAPAAPACCGAGGGAIPATPVPSLSNYSAPSYPAPTSPAPSYAGPSYPAPSAPAPLPAGSPGTTLQSLTPTPQPSLSAVPSLPPSNGALSNGAPSGPITSGTSAPPVDVTPTPAGAPESGPEPQSRMLLPPRSEAAPMSGRGRGLDPETYDRTTAIPVRQAYSVRPASYVEPIRVPAPTTAANDGWRAPRN